MKTIQKSAWLYIEDRKVLFVRTEGKDIFYVVGGHIETGETEVEALIREVKEEVSVDLLPESIVELLRFSAPAHGRPGVTVEMFCFTADYVGKLMPASEIAEMAWWNSSMMDQATEPGKKILTYLKEQDLID